MTDTVDLMVVGVTGDISRKDLLQKLVAEFKQDGAAFEPLLDAAYGESAPYAAQSGVSAALAEEGKQQLEKLGLVCSVGSKDSIQVASPAQDAEVAADSTEAPAETALPDSEELEASTASDDDSDLSVDDLSFESFDDAELEEASAEPDEISDSASEAEEFDLPDFASDATESEEAPAATDADSKKSDVPAALAAGSFDDLQAELIDPEPIEKVKKEPVALDDGGLSLSDDDSAPLTAPKAKSDPDAANDGGLSLASDSENDAESADLKDAVSNTEEPVESAIQTPEADVSFDALSEDLAEDSASAEPEVADNPSNASNEIENDSAETASELPPVENTTEEAAAEEPVAEKAEAEEPKAEELADKESEALTPADNTDSAASDDPLGNILADLSDKTDGVADSADASAGGLVLPGQLETSAVVPQITPEDEIGNDVSSAVETTEEVAEAAVDEKQKTTEDKQTSRKDKEPKAEKESSGNKKKLVAALAGAVLLAGGGTFAVMNAGSMFPSSDDDMEISVANAKPNDRVVVKPVDIDVEELAATSDLETLSTEELLVNLSATSDTTSIVNLEPYFLESVTRTRNAPRFGAAVPAESESMVEVENRVPHPADKYFDDWSTREADLSLFLSLMDDLIEKGELEVAQQLSDRAKDKLFAVMSSQRLARAYSDVGKNAEVSMLMTRAARETFAVKSAEERVLAISDYGLTEQAIGLNEEAIDTFLTASILARSLGRLEMKAVGLSSAARYFQRSGRENEAQQLLKESMSAGLELPKSAAARDLAIRYVALSEARMGLFNQALEHTKLIVDPFASVSAYHGIALAIERSGDENNARKVLNMAYRAGSHISDKEQRSKLLSKVVLANEMD